MKTILGVLMLLTYLMLPAPRQQTQQSPHGKIRYSCQTCHTTAGWKMRPDSKFDHAETGFALAGQHIPVKCASCHPRLVFAGTSGLCSACHADVHAGTLGTECARCHDPRSWVIPDMVQRHQTTRFPLLGRHAALDCQACHTGAAATRFVGTPVTCIGCHRSDYMGTVDPNHTQAGFSIECAECHQVTAFAWSASFDHALTGFALTGAHRGATCIACHTGGSYATTPSECAICHDADRRSTTDPDHVAAGFPSTCQTCHTTAAWVPSTFAHDNTAFPLTGAHRAVVCTDCHTQNRYAGLPAGCFDCHDADYLATTNPAHQTLGFPQNCLDCHTTAAWQPASFDHSATDFPLTGRHTTTTCESCHMGGDYTITYTDCFACHAADYQVPTNPNHVIPNFSHQCETCHTTTAWKPSTFDHDGQYFRIYSGAHRQRWTACSECHGNPASYAEFTCTTCHTQPETDPDHNEVPNYVFSSPSCYACHRGA